MDLTFKREFSYYLLTIYVPCCMLVIVSWVSFWLDPNAVPARVSLGVTTLLTMSTQQVSGREIVQCCIPESEEIFLFTLKCSVWEYYYCCCCRLIFKPTVPEPIYQSVWYCLNCSKHNLHNKRDQSWTAGLLGSPSGSVTQQLTTQQHPNKHSPDDVILMTPCPGQHQQLAAPRGLHQGHRRVDGRLHLLRVRGAAGVCAGELRLTL